MRNPFSKLRCWLNTRQETSYRESAEESVYIDTELIIDVTDKHPYTKMWITIEGVHILEVMHGDEIALKPLQIDNCDAHVILELYRERYIANERKGRGTRA